MTKCLVFGADLSEEGAALGPRTITRVQQAIVLAKADPLIELVFAAPIEGTGKYPRMTKALGQMMMEYVWKIKPGVPTLFINQATGFHTEGEVAAFFAHGFGDEPFIVVSSKFHLPRIWWLIARRTGFRFATSSVEYVSSSVEEPAGPKILFLELCKWVLMFFPDEWKPKAERLYERVFGKRSI